MLSLERPLLLNPLTKALRPLDPHATELKRPREPLPLRIDEAQHRRDRELELFNKRSA